jgi:mono/diheme cytochrome c family protein
MADKKHCLSLRLVAVLAMYGSMALVSMAVGGCGAKQTAAEPALVSNEEARVLYARFCANCHGRDLGGGMASSLVDGRWEYSDDDAALYDVITAGLPDAGMPSFSAGMTSAQIGALVELMRQAEKRRAAGE